MSVRPFTIRHKGKQSAIFFRNFRNFPQFFRNFPAIFPQFLGGYHNFYPWEYLILQFLLEIQNHNVWFKIHNFCFEHPFLSKFVKFDHKMREKCFLLEFGLVWTCNFWRPFPCPLSKNRNFSKSQLQFPLEKNPQFFRNFSAIFPQFPQFFRNFFAISAIFPQFFGGVLRPQFPPPWGKEKAHT